MTKYDMYCPKCHDWVMAEESATDRWHKVPQGASKLVYTCPQCKGVIIPSWAKQNKESSQKDPLENRDPTPEEFLDIQDLLSNAYPTEFDRLHTHIQNATGKEPSPARMVRRFKDEFPELYQTLYTTKR